MFILKLTYKKPLSEVDRYIELHRKYLDKFYNSGNFIASGRQNPRIGGVILCQANDKNEVEHIIAQDPFFINDIADYEITEFEVSKSHWPKQ